MCDCKVHSRYDNDKPATTVEKVYSPARPCRRGCSTEHSPDLHEERATIDRMQRLNETETRLLLIETQPRALSPILKYRGGKNLDLQKSGVYQQFLISKGINHHRDKNGYFVISEDSPLGDPASQQQLPLDLTTLDYYTQLCKATTVFERTSSVDIE